VFAAYYKAHQGDVAKWMESGLAGALEGLLMGHAVDPFGGAMSNIQAAGAGSSRRVRLSAWEYQHADRRCTAA